MIRASGKGLALSVCLLSASAAAQDISVSDVTVTRGQGWSSLAGQTVGAGDTVISIQAGFPGVSASLLQGVSQQFDVGGRFGFQYSYDGLVNAFAPGLTFQALLRYQVLDGDRFDVALTAAPGLFLHFRQLGGTLVTIAVPVGVVAGVPIGSALMLNVGLELRVLGGIGTLGGAYVPILAGVGAEYFLSRDVALTFNTRMGPAISSATTFAFEALVGVAFKL